jgi:DNA-binding winged helix-turn-helix (wHTH) protein
MRPPSRIFTFGPFQMDVGERLLLRHGKRISLTPKLFETLLVLLENVGHLVQRDELVRAVWKDTFVEEGNLAHNVSVLRKILGPAADGSSYIETVPRHGYRFLGGVKPLKASASPSAAKHGSAAIRSIAVLPLENLSRDANNVYFADGMTEALITGLAQTLPLRVISRTSIMRYKRVKKPLPAIGKELNVDAIVELYARLQTGWRVCAMLKNFNQTSLCSTSACPFSVASRQRPAFGGSLPRLESSFSVSTNWQG